MRRCPPPERLHVRAARVCHGGCQPRAGWNGGRGEEAPQNALPVRGDGGGALVERPQALAPYGAQLLARGPEPGFQVGSAGVFVHENRTPAEGAACGNEPALLPPQVDEVALVGDGNELARRVVGPAVILAAEGAVAPAGDSHHGRSPVAAAVVEAAHHAIDRVDDQQRDARLLPGQVEARPRDLVEAPRQQPGLPEDPRPLHVVEGAIDEALCGQADRLAIAAARRLRLQAAADLVGKRHDRSPPRVELARL